MFELIDITPNPFNNIDQRTANAIILCEKKGFSKATIGARVVYDYTPYQNLYNDLTKYLFRNYQYFLNRAPEIHRLSFGNAVIHLLRTGKF